MSHGQAASIRSSVTSETFDLAGQNVTTIESTIRDAFREPFDLSEMIRLTFITGAGKLGRARYDDNAAKAVTTTLRELGYEEDRGASSVMECAGSFKLQHDTGKNLKTVVVFPKVKSNATTSNNGSGSGDTTAQSTIIVEGSIDHKIAYTSMNVFPRMIESQCLTWSQKKACIGVLTDIRQIVEKLDEKLVKGNPLSDPEQQLYDSVSITSLDEKIACVRDIMQKQFEKGELTESEKRQLISQVDSKIKELQENISNAEKEGKPKRVENLKEALKNAKTRKDKLTSISPKSPPKLKNEAEILKLRTELVPLLELEASAKGRLLSIKESQSLAKKEEIESQIIQLEETSRGWFESDEAFEERKKASRDYWKSTRKQQSGKSKPKPPTNTTAGGGTKRVVPTTTTSKPLSTTVSSNKSQATKSKTPGGLFAAMMLDSDSD